MSANGTDVYLQLLRVDGAFFQLSPRELSHPVFTDDEHKHCVV